jgi:urease accessory protein
MEVVSYCNILTGGRVLITIINKRMDNLTNASMPESKNYDWLGGLIQTTDTLFPSGGYAHSYGLEEMVALNQVTSAKDLEEFLMQQILPSLEKLELPYLRYCLEAVEKNNLNELVRLNEEISAWKLTREMRDAGKSQGAQLLRMILEIHQCPVSIDFNQLLKNRGDQCQQITATALLRNTQKAPLISAMIAWIYQAVSNFCSASIKLLRLGELACQKIIHRCIDGARVQELLSKSIDVQRGDAGFFNPLLDIASARHELAFSRLFIS